uniref:Uncharacterized protein n=1 Tax=Cacopsylla melanoneura TaxID=428564 RepID=A0A8D8LXJ1_9HEMI
MGGGGGGGAGGGGGGGVRGGGAFLVETNSKEVCMCSTFHFLENYRQNFYYSSSYLIFLNFYTHSKHDSIWCIVCIVAAGAYYRVLVLATLLNRNVTTLLKQNNLCPILPLYGTEFYKYVWRNLIGRNSKSCNFIGRKWRNRALI